MKNFFELYANSKRKERTELRNEILKRCSFEYSTFYRKMENKSFTSLEQKEIANILNMPKCELFPVEKNKYSLVIN